MKFYSNQIANIVDAINKSRINAVLFYGPDHGLVDYLANQVAKSLKLEKRSISYNNSSFDEINNALNNASLFGTKEVIRLQDMPATIDAKFSAWVKLPHYHVLIITADELSPSSSLRKIFEQEGNLGAVACYTDNEESVEKIIRHYCNEFGKNISTEALKYLGTYLHGDRYIIINELEKLFCYVSNKSHITIEDVTEVISYSTLPEPDKLCLYFLEGNLKGYFEELKKLLSENTPPVWIVRAIIRYHINVYIVLQKTSDGMNVADAISSLSPPIFFKYILQFKNIIAKNTSAKIHHSLHVLYEAEKEIKSSGTNPNQICENIFFRCNSHL